VTCRDRRAPTRRGRRHTAPRAADPDRVVGAVARYLFLKRRRRGSRARDHRDEMDQREDQRRDAEEHRHRQEKTPREVRQHGVSLSLGLRSPVLGLQSSVRGWTIRSRY
jgi:hypothetical protein